MPPNFDVRDQPCIPVVTSSNTTELVSLRETLHRAHELSDIAVTNPPAAAGVRRLLYITAARATGLDRHLSADEWVDLRWDLAEQGCLTPGKVDAYLDQHTGRWDLFDPHHPFLQDPRLAEQSKRVGVHKIDAARPGGNTPVFNRHTHHGYNPAIPTPQAVEWMLFHLLCGSPGAGATRHTTQHRDQYMSVSPLRSSLTHYPLGRNLFESVLAGIPSPTLDPAPGELDVAPWERDTHPDPDTTPPPVTWPAGLLLGRARHALLLVPDDDGSHVVDCYLTWAYKHPTPPAVDPYVIWEVKKTTKDSDGQQQAQWGYRRASRHRAVWRDVDALLASTADRHRPRVLTATLDLPPEVRNNLRIRVHGVDQEYGQEGNHQWMTATTPPIMPLLEETDPDAARGAEDLHTAAEHVAKTARWALNRAHTSLMVSSSGPARKDCPWSAPFDTAFWGNAETVFWQRLHARDFSNPYRAFAHVALDAIDAATDHEQHHLPVARAISGVRAAIWKTVPNALPAKETARAE